MTSRPLSAVVLAPLFVCAFANAQNEIASGGWFAYGTGIGNGDFHVSTANGQTEIVVPCGSASFNAGSRFWVLAAHNPTTSEYDQAFVSPIYDSNDAIVRTAVADVDSAAGPEIIIATKTGRVEIWNQMTRVLLDSFQANINEVRGLGIADVDGDNDEDVVLCSQFAIAAFDLDGTMLWTLAGTGGLDLTIGQMDADPALEIATTDGSIVDCGTESVQWQWMNGFGIDLDNHDIDGDGFDEIVFGEDWNWVWAFDIDVQLPKWSLSLGDIACVRIGQVDADPAMEILVGEGQWGDVLAYDSVTQQLERTYSNPEHGVTSVAVGDVDNDGTPEIIWGAGFTSTGPDYWYIADAASQQTEWTSPAVRPGFVGPVRGDVDGDGQDELVCAAPGLSSGSAPGRLLIFDAATLAVEHISGSVGSSSYGASARDLELADVDNDGDFEIFLADNKVTAYDWNGITLTQLWQVGPTSSFSGPQYGQVTVADLDGDNGLEVVIGSDDYVHVYDYGSTTELWHSFYLGGEAVEVIAANSNTTPELEIHVLSDDGNLYVFDGATFSAAAILQDGGTNRTAVHVLDGLPALIMGDELGHMYLYINGGNGYAGIGPLPVATSQINGLGYYDSLGIFHVAADERLALHFGLFPAWQTAQYGEGGTSGTPFGKQVSLDLATGRVAACGTFGLTVFDL